MKIYKHSKLKIGFKTVSYKFTPRQSDKAAMIL
jgi:hypothetical protein